MPQFLLRRFADSDGGLEVFDKSSDRTFRTGTRAVAAEAYFYDLEIGGDVLTLEPGLTHLEGRAAATIERVHESESLAPLSPEDRALLAAFIAVQALRTQHQRANILHMSRLLVERVNRIVPEDRSEAALPSPTEEDAQRISMALLLDGANEIALIIAAKPWVLARAPEGDFYIGDNPVAMHNERDFGIYGSIGFAVPGVEIHFPIGPSLSLFIPCHSTVGQWRDALADMELLRQVDQPAWSLLVPRLPSIEALVHAVDSGDPIELGPENVERENSLQVAYAGRWLFSATGNFDLARRMTATDPRNRHGPFGTVS